MSRPKVGIACSEDIRNSSVDAVDLVRLDAVADFRFRDFAVASDLSGPAPRDAEAEAELARFASELDVLVVSHGAPYVSAEVLAGAPGGGPGAGQNDR